MAVSTFLDANILIGAHRGQPVVKEACLKILNDPDRSFIASDFLYLELMPKAVYYKNEREAEFYRAYFDAVRIWISDVESIVNVAREESERCGLAAMDALHIAAAYKAEAEVFFTLEGKNKPMGRTSLVPVIFL